MDLFLAVWKKELQMLTRNFFAHQETVKKRKKGYDSFVVCSHPTSSLLSLKWKCRQDWTSGFLGHVVKSPGWRSLRISTSCFCKFSAQIVLFIFMLLSLKWWLEENCARKTEIVMMGKELHEEKPTSLFPMKLVSNNQPPAAMFHSIRPAACPARRQNSLPLLHREATVSSPA